MPLRPPFATLLVLSFLPSIALGQATALRLTGPDATLVSITRDAYGVPHIRGESEAGVFFGQGFAVAQDRLLQLEQFRRAALGRAAEVPLVGSGFVELDEDTRTLFYTEAERRTQFDGLPFEIRSLLEAYAAGVNVYLDSMAVNPSRFKPLDIAFYEALGLDIEPWEPVHSLAVVQFFFRVFGEWGGQELRRLSELQEHGPAWFDVHRPINDPSVPTTIPEGSSAPAASVSYAGPPVRYEVVDEQVARSVRMKELMQRGEIPGKWGSFSAVVGAGRSEDGSALLLGAPQMGDLDRTSTSPVHELELNCPDLHVGGVTVAGIPGAIIGRTPRLAWTMTSGFSDNKDVYIETTRDSTLSQYRFNGEWRDFERIVDTMKVSGDERTFVHYRSVHGPIFDFDEETGQAFAIKMTFWNRELDGVLGMYRIWKAATMAEVEEALALMPLSFNVSVALRDGQIGYWHVGLYQDRTDGVDPRLPHVGDGSEEWGGLIPFAALPQSKNPQQGYLVNWNSKPVAWWDNGDNVPWAFENELDREDTTERIRYLDDVFAALPQVGLDDLAGAPERMMERCIAEGLGSVCNHNALQGTYQQAIALSETSSRGWNIVPPGQSAFVSMSSARSPHLRDQWDLYLSFGYKDMLFGEEVASAAGAGGVPEEVEGFTVYPNPAVGLVRAVVRLGRPARVSVRVYDVLGRHISGEELGDLPSGRQVVPLDLSALSPGAYLVRLRVGDEVRSRTVVVGRR